MRKASIRSVPNGRGQLQLAIVNGLARLAEALVQQLCMMALLMSSKTTGNNSLLKVVQDMSGRVPASQFTPCSSH